MTRTGVLALAALLSLSLAQGWAISPHAQVRSRPASENPGDTSPKSELKTAPAREPEEQVRALRLVSTFKTGNPGAHLASPRLAGDRLLLLTPFPHKLLTFRLGSGGWQPDWHFEPEADRMAEGTACCGLGIPGPALSADRIYLNTVDGRTIALDAGTGHPVWAVRTAGGGNGETLASSPVVAGDKILVGNSGDDYGARGWLRALDASTGRTLWTRYSTGPDEDVGIGADFAPAYGPKGKAEAGVRSWPPGAWERGGGSVSGPILHDPGLGLIFHGTGRPAPLNPDQRPGDNRWTSGLFARDDRTGAARWFYGLSSHDLHGVSGTGPLFMADRRWKGQDRKLLIHAGLNGYVYVLDRLTGEVLSAQPFVPVDASRGVELKTGTLLANDDKRTRLGSRSRDVCPSLTGATSSEGASLSSDGQTLFIASSRLCMDIEIRPANYVAGTPYLGANIRVKGSREGGRGALVAWRLDKAKPAWTVAEQWPLLGAPLPIPGGSVLYGTLDGYLKLVDERDGSPLWQQKLSSGIISAPVLLRGPDGGDYVAVVAGRGGSVGPNAGLEVDVRDATAGRGFGNLLRGLPPPEDASGALYLFALP
ncbi:PQQ-binding-like beta-propeller repeat protein [Enterovirga sp. CN4-39]|uniref:outer membrane protein assembly factor BamB family protein n=1 Tax=Enterovirga sp. CN4-39 TaxID=3400910 RepID=UPI003C2FFAE8